MLLFVNMIMIYFHQRDFRGILFQNFGILATLRITLTT